MPIFKKVLRIGRRDLKLAARWHAEKDPVTRWFDLRRPVVDDALGEAPDAIADARGFSSSPRAYVKREGASPSFLLRRR